MLVSSQHTVRYKRFGTVVSASDEMNNRCMTGLDVRVVWRAAAWQNGACSEQFLEKYMLTQDAQLVERKAQSMDPRIREYFRQNIVRIDYYLPQCEEFWTSGAIES